jgi:beta-galactosidase
MEQNATGIRVDGRTLAKGEDRMIRHCLGYIARGAQSSLFFQWRQSAGGAEQWHGALVPHAGRRSRIVESVVRLGGLLERLAPVAALPAEGPLVSAEVGILWHADGWWALETPDLPSSHLSYSAEVRAAHRSFWRAGIPVDFVRPLADLSRHRLLVLAAQYPLDDAQVTWLEEYVAGGGELVVTYLSGLADEHLRVATGGYPGRLRDLLGVRGQELLPLPAGERIRLSDGSGAEEWTELLEAVDAEVLATYTHGDLAGLPAITRARRGAGGAVYVSAGWTQEARDARLAELAAGLGIRPTLPGAAAAGLEAVRRRGDGADHVFLLHHGERPVTVRAPGEDLLTGASAREGLRLPAGGAAVLSLAPSAPIDLLEH